jgi:hypothetical protein
MLPQSASVPPWEDPMPEREEGDSWMIPPKAWEPSAEGGWASVRTRDGEVFIGKAIESSSAEVTLRLLGSNQVRRFRSLDGCACGTLRAHSHADRARAAARQRRGAPAAVLVPAKVQSLFGR